MRNKLYYKDAKREKKIITIKRSKSWCQKENQSKLDNWYDEIIAYLNKQILNADIYFSPDVFLSSFYCTYDVACPLRSTKVAWVIMRIFPVNRNFNDLAESKSGRRNVRWHY